jgi:hypothetical protein
MRFTTIIEYVVRNVFSIMVDDVSVVCSESFIRHHVLWAATKCPLSTYSFTTDERND